MAAKSCKHKHHNRDSRTKKKKQIKKCSAIYFHDNVIWTQLYSWAQRNVTEFSKIMEVAVLIHPTISWKVMLHLLQYCFWCEFKPFNKLLLPLATVNLIPADIFRFSTLVPWPVWLYSPENMVVKTWNAWKKKILNQSFQVKMENALKGRIVKYVKLNVWSAARSSQNLLLLSSLASQQGPGGHTKWLIGTETEVVSPLSCQASSHIRHHYFIKRETWETPAGRVIYAEQCTVTERTYENKGQTILLLQDVTGNGLWGYSNLIKK